MCILINSYAFIFLLFCFFKFYDYRIVICAASLHLWILFTLAQNVKQAASSNPDSSHVSSLDKMLMQVFSLASCALCCTFFFGKIYYP